MADKNLVVLDRGAVKKPASSDTAVVSGLGLTNQGELQLRELSTNGSNYVSHRAAANMSSNYTVTWPASAPGSNTYLKYDGSNYVWATVSGGGSVSYYQETPSGAVNGTNTAFTILNEPGTSDALLVYVNGLLKRKTTDYTYSSLTITFTTAPAPGSDVYAVYTSATNDVQEVPSGTVNGSNTAFTLAQTPASNATVTIYLDGVLQRQGAGADRYTISGSNITFGTAPAGGQVVYAVYKT
jgi:hypothetical protein